MDPMTGEILALANCPTFDLNEYRVATEEREAQSRGAAHLRAGLDLQVVHRRGGARRAAHADVAHVRHQRRLHQLRHRAGSTTCTATGRCRSWTSSSSRATSAPSRSARRSGSDVVSRYVYRFGFGETLARDIPHQRAGLVDKRLPQFKPSELASVSMGYQIGVTPLQMVAAVGSIANGGELIAPHVVRATIVDGVRTEVPRAGRPAHDLRRDRRRADDDPRAGGRARHGQGGADPRLHHRRQDRHRREARERPLLEGRTTTCRSSASCRRGNPRAVILAVLDSPRRGGRTGGEVAAPVFRAVAEATLRRLGVPPTDAGSARPAGRAERAGRADAGQPAADRARADPRRGAGPGDRAGHAPRRPRPVGARGHARAAPRRRRAAALRQRRGLAPVPAAGTVIRPGQTCDLVLVRARRRNPIRSAGSNHDARRSSSNATSSLVALDLVAPLGAADRARPVAGVEFDSRRVVAGSVFVGDEGREGRRRRLRAAGARQGRVRGRRGSAGAGRLDAAVGPRRRRSRWRWRRWRRSSTATRATTCCVVGITGTNGKTTTSYLTAGDLRRGRRPLRPHRHRLATASAARERDAARTTPEASDVQRMLREMVDARLRRLRDGGVVARAGAEARRPRPLRRRRLHQPDPRSPRLPRRHGVVLRGQAPAVRAAAGRRDRRRSTSTIPYGPRAGRRRSSARSPSASTSPPTSTPGRSTCRSTASSFEIQTPRGAIRVRSPLLGRPNVYNILAAAAVAIGLDLPHRAIQQGIARVDARARPVRARVAATATTSAWSSTTPTPTTR